MSRLKPSALYGLMQRSRNHQSGSTGSCWLPAPGPQTMPPSLLLVLAAVALETFVAGRLHSAFNIPTSVQQAAGKGTQPGLDTIATGPKSRLAPPLRGDSHRSRSRGCAAAGIVGGVAAVRAAAAAACGGVAAAPARLPERLNFRGRLEYVSAVVGTTGTGESSLGRLDRAQAACKAMRAKSSCTRRAVVGPPPLHAGAGQASRQQRAAN